MTSSLPANAVPSNGKQHVHEALLSDQQIIAATAKAPHLCQRVTAIHGSILSLHAAYNIAAHGYSERAWDKAPKIGWHQTIQSILQTQGVVKCG